MWLAFQNLDNIRNFRNKGKLNIFSNHVSFPESRDAQDDKERLHSRGWNCDKYIHLEGITSVPPTVCQNLQWIYRGI